MKLFQILVLALTTLVSMPAFCQDNGTSNMEILRQKIKADKKLVVAANMNLTEPEAKAFWPVYDAYQNDLQRINQRIGKVISEYADAYNTGRVEDDTAKRLLNETLAIEEAETKLKRTYATRLEKAIPATKVARYMQIENKIRAVIRYELAAEIPLAQ